MKKNQRTSKRVLYAIVALFFGPLLLAWVLYEHQSWLPQHTTNRGFLINPPLDAYSLSFTEKPGKPFHLTQYHGKWLMLFFNPEQCDAACEKELYLMRQIRIALGKDQNRVQRLFITDVKQESQTWLGKLKTQYPQMQIAYAKPSEHVEFDRKLSKVLSPKAGYRRLYLIDPLGNLMMAYRVDASPKDVLKDLKKLLRASQIG